MPLHGVLLSFSPFASCLLLVLFDSLYRHVSCSALLMQINERVSLSSFSCTCGDSDLRMRYCRPFDLFFQMLTANGIFARFTAMMAHLCILITIFVEQVSVYTALDLTNSDLE